MKEKVKITDKGNIMVKAGMLDDGTPMAVLFSKGRSKKTKEMDNDSVKQSSFMNSLKDTDNNLYPLKFVCMLRVVVLICCNGIVFPQVIGEQPH